jgi:DNA-binding XRE family transcriptional regulator
MKKVSSKQRQESQNLLKTAADLGDALQTNDWPLGAKQRPFTSLGGGEWVALSKEEAEADPERARKIEHGKKSEVLCLRWRQHLGELLENCRRYVNDYGDPEQTRRFENNMLVSVLKAREQLEREFYTTEQCSRDLDSLKTLMKSFRSSHGRSWRKAIASKRLQFCKALRTARSAHNHTQEEAAAAIGIGQSEYSLYENCKRKPTGVNLKNCMTYIHENLEDDSSN